MDGYTSAALLINYIRMQQKYGDWVDCSPEIVHILHTGKIHGLDDTEVMDKVLNTIKPDLFVIPDASGNNKQYQALTSAGIDVVVLDHHDMSERDVMDLRSAETRFLVFEGLKPENLRSYYLEYAKFANYKI